MKAIAIKYENIAYFLHGAANSDLWEKYAGKYYQLPKGYSFRYDIARFPNCKDNIHISRNGTLLGAFNQDGSSHDNSKFRIPKIVADYIAKHILKFTIPDNRIVEFSSIKDQDMLLLLENIQKGNNFESLFAIDLDEIDNELDEQIKLLKDLLEYLR